MAAGSGGNPMYSPYSQGPRIRIEVIGEAWQLFSQQMGTWIMALITIFVALLIPSFLVGMGIVSSGLLASRLSERAGGTVFGIGMMFVLVAGVVLTAMVTIFSVGGLHRMATKQVRGEPIQISDLWSVGDVFWKLLGATILMGLASGVSALLCYLPMFVVNGLLMLTIPLIVDGRMSATDAMAKSWNTLKQEWLMVTILYFLLSLVSMLGMIVVYIGLLFTAPLLFLGTALVYRDFILGGTPPLAPMSYTAGNTPGAYPPNLYSAQPPPDERR